jgi:hypothetical protein
LTDASIERFCITILLFKHAFSSQIERLRFNPIVLPGEVVGTLKKTFCGGEVGCMPAMYTVPDTGAGRN